MVMENHEKKSKSIIIIVFIMIAVLGLLFWLVGVTGIMNVLKWFFIIMIILMIFGGVVYFVWYFFIRKQKFDVTYINKQKLLDACHKGHTGLMTELFLSGDKGHSRVYWGKITGYCRISVLTKKLKFDKDDKQIMVLNKEGKLEEDYDIEKEEQDVFSVSHRGWLLGLFEEEDVVRVSPDSHNNLIGSIDLYGYSLIPLSEYWFLNNDLLDVRKIDYAILKEAERSIMFEQQKDFKELVDKASGLDTDHQKKIEEKSAYEIPINQNN